MFNMTRAIIESKSEIDFVDRIIVDRNTPFYNNVLDNLYRQTKRPYHTTV